MQGEIRHVQPESKVVCQMRQAAMHEFVGEE